MESKNKIEEKKEEEIKVNKDDDKDKEKEKDNDLIGIDDRFVEEPLKTEEMINKEVEKLMNEKYDSDKPLDKFWDLNIEPDEAELFEKNDDLPDAQINDKEIMDQLEEYQRQLEKEVNEEMEKTYKPTLFEENIQRAEELLARDELIKKAVDDKTISKDEVIVFIEYYELFSVMNKCRKYTIEELKKLNQYLIKKIKLENQEGEDNEGEEEEYEEEEEEKKEEVYVDEEDAINKLTKEIESKFTVDSTILDNRFNAEILKFNKSDFLTSVKIDSNKDNNQNNDDKEKKVAKTESNSPKKTTSEKAAALAKKKKLKSPQKPSREVIIANNVNNQKEFSEKIKELALSSGFMGMKQDFSKIESTIPKFIPTNKRVQIYAKNKKNTDNMKFDLFNDKADIKSMQKIRGDRREIVKFQMEKKGSIMKDLYKFKSNMTKAENNKIKENLEKLFELPKTNLNPNRKSAIRKKIEDAQNYGKKSNK